MKTKLSKKKLFCAIYTVVVKWKLYFNYLFLSVGGSFKMAFEVANTRAPNSTKSTIVFSMFEAPDNPHNLKMALDRYREDIDCLQNEKWRQVL